MNPRRKACLVSSSLTALLVSPGVLAQDFERRVMTAISSKLDDSTRIHLDGSWTFRRFEGGWAATPNGEGTRLRLDKDLGGPTEFRGRVWLVIDETLGWLLATRDEAAAIFEEKMAKAAAESNQKDPGAAPPGEPEDVTPVFQAMARVDRAVIRFRAREGRVPKDVSELRDSGTLPADPFGRPFRIVPLEGAGHDVATLGADGLAGGEGADADFSLVALAAARGFLTFAYPDGSYSESGWSGDAFADRDIAEDGFLASAEHERGVALVRVRVKGEKNRGDERWAGFVLSRGVLAGSVLHDAEGGVEIRFAQRVE